jgi:hypothetical protein
MTLVRKTMVAVLGGALLMAGVAMLVRPGPAVVVLPAALALLAVEFLWAWRWLAWLPERYKAVPANNPAFSPNFNHDEP